MKLIQRIDRISVGLLRPHKNPDGSVWFEGRAARPGVHLYDDGNGGTIRELVDEDTLGRPDDLATLAGAPVTLNHPRAMVTPDTYRDVAGGFVGNDIEQEAAGGFVRVKVRAARRDLLDAIGSNRAVELSCGYEAEIDYTPGEHPTFGRYDQRQIRRVYNHLAVVPKGRHGPLVSLRVDGACERIEDAEPWRIERHGATASAEDRGGSMLTRATVLALIAASFPAPSADAEGVTDEARADHKRRSEALADAVVTVATPAAASTEGKADAGEMIEKAKYDKLMADFEKLKADMEAMKSKKDAAPSPTQRQEHAHLVAFGHALKIDKLDSRTDDELREAIVRAKRGDAIPRDASPEVIAAHWHILVSEGVPSTGSRADAAAPNKPTVYRSAFDSLEAERRGLIKTSTVTA